MIGGQNTVFDFRLTSDPLVRVCGHSSQVDLKVDHDAGGFSCQNAFFFAKMCDTAYSNREEVKAIMLGNETITGLGFEHFKWFEVSICGIVIVRFVKPIMALYNV